MPNSMIPNRTSSSTGSASAVSISACPLSLESFVFTAATSSPRSPPRLAPATTSVAAAASATSEHVARVSERISDPVAEDVVRSRQSHGEHDRQNRVLEQLESVFLHDQPLQRLFHFRTP